MKIILVTGASKGIGKEIAKTLANDENKVIANYNKSGKEALELQKENSKIDIYKADVSKREQVNKMIQDIILKYGKIDVLINNAGIDQFKLFTDITEEEWDNMIKTNLTSAFYTTQEAVKNMIKNKTGCIINISSIYAITGGACEVHYSVSKAGLDGLTKSLARELAPSNIRVNSVAPGAILTDMNKNLSKEDFKQVESEIPLGRFGTPQEIAKCVKWLVEDTYTTGQIISPNGGWVI